MNSFVALVKREYLEHQGAFVIAPAAITALLILVFAAGIFLGHSDIQQEFDMTLEKATLFEAMYGATIMLWTVYLMIALFFYFSDAFSADRKNNGLLFWKSMPQTDLKILGTKALAGGTIFPMAIGGWILISGVMAYLFSIWLSSIVPGVGASNPISFLNSYVQMSVSGAVFIFLTLLWLSPFFAWVGMLSTVFKRWSIPLAFVIPGLLVLAERIFRIGDSKFQSQIGKFIGYRLESMFKNDMAFEQLIENQDFNAFALIWTMFSELNWLHLFIGIAIAAVFVYAASEYRRRLIEA